MIKVGQTVLSAATGKPFKVLEVRLAKDYKNDPGAFDAVLVKRIFPPHAEVEQWERDRTALWRMDKITLGQMQLQI